jgi:bacillopeptidase F
MTYRKNYLISVLLVSIIILLSFIAFETFSDQHKISDEVLQQILSGKEEIEILIYLDHQLDTLAVANQVEQNLIGINQANDNVKILRRTVTNSLQDHADRSQESLKRFLNRNKDAGSVYIVESFFVVNMIYAIVSPEMVKEIAARQDVKYIYPNSEFALEKPVTEEILFVQEDDSLSWNIKHIGAQHVWQKYGVDGEGVVIGIIDTGVDWEHPALKNSWRGFNQGDATADYNWFDAVYNNSMPQDKNGHGTSIIGIAVGNDLDNNQQIGVAPGAKWIACQGLGDNGSGMKSNLIKAGQFMLAPTNLEGENPNPDMAPDIIINSWGGNFGEDDWYMQMVENWRNAGIFPVFAAGNSPNSINNPANYPISFGVGAVDLHNNLASFSSRGPGAYGDIIKPELVAPGVQVFSSKIDNKYGYMNGTSFAASHVAGAAALLLSYQPSINVDDLENILKETATPLVDDSYLLSPNYGFGYGLVDPLSALDSLVSSRHTLVILIDGQGITKPAPGIYTIPAGEVLALEAFADIGWKFEKWIIGDTEYSGNVHNILMDSNKVIEAVFIEIEESDWIIIDPPTELVGLDELWKITFNRSFSTNEIEAVVVEFEGSSINVDIVFEEEKGQVLITPETPYLPNETYTLKIFLSNSKWYRMFFETEAPH